MQPLITIENLKKVYSLGGEKVYALNGVNLTIYKEEILCLLGKSGSGKSTLLNMMAGLDKPSSGHIYIGPEKKLDITALSEKQITKFRQKNVGFVFQSYNLISTLDATENVSLGMIFKGIDKKKREEASEDILKKVGLENRLRHKPSEMSGGQQQRVSIARAFVDKPRIVFADEPTGNLDTNTSFEIMNLMCQMARDYKQTLIIVTHDEETSIYADRIVEMRDGKILSITENNARIPKNSQSIATDEEMETKEQDLNNDSNKENNTISEKTSDNFSSLEDNNNSSQKITNDYTYLKNSTEIKPQNNILKDDDISEKNITEDDNISEKYSLL